MKLNKTYYFIIFSVIILLIIILSFTFGKFQNQRAKHIVKHIHSVNNVKTYAYKSLTGLESPLVYEKLENKTDTTSKPVNIKTNTTSEHLSSENETKHINKTSYHSIVGTNNDELVINKIFNHLFDSFLYDNTKINIEKQYQETLNNRYTSEQAHKLEPEVERFINGSFSWDYRNEQNKDDFLAYRAGNYIYDNKIVNASELYNQIYNKVKEQHLIIKVNFNSDDTKVYIHPNGGYVIDKKITLVINKSDSQNNIIKGHPYTFSYRGIFNFRTPTTSDLWYLWTNNDTGILLLSDNYVYQDLIESEVPK
jgi:hypothetical protein